MTSSSIPKKLHLIWVGDESKRPDKWMQTWKDNHPDWEFRIWGNEELNNHPWVCKKQIDIMKNDRVWEGVADAMRYEILLEHGGVYADADSKSLKPLDDTILNCEFFAVYESEIHRPGLVTNCYMGSVAGNPILKDLIDTIHSMDHPLYKWSWKRLRKRRVQAWKTTGPKLLTKILKKYKDANIRIFPSALFLPEHFADNQNNKAMENAYATHLWGTTSKNYG